MSSLTDFTALKALNAVHHPFTQSGLVDLKVVKDLKLEDTKAQLTLELFLPNSPVAKQLASAVESALKEVGATHVEVEQAFRQRSTQPALGGGPLSEAKNIVAVASGKGGVGKSTVASNLAAALADAGCSVGLMDADVYGPSVPALLGIDRSSLKVLGKQIQPVEKYGLRVMSMGLLMKPGDSVIWRGPMLHGMMNQFCKDVNWGPLDYMVIDLPPGTGDVSLSLSQLIPIGGSVVVSTPQDVALGVATKALNMFEKLNVPVLGLVENMSYYSCPHCGERDDLFGHGGAKGAAQQRGLPFLGEIPLNGAVRQAGDQGKPVVLAHPESKPAEVFRELAARTAALMGVASEQGYEAILSPARV